MANVIDSPALAKMLLGYYRFISLVTANNSIGLFKILQCYYNDIPGISLHQQLLMKCQAFETRSLFEGEDFIHQPL